MEHERPKEFVIHIDDKEFKVHESSLSGAQLKALVGKDATYQLFEEIPGNDPDKLILDTTAVQIRDGLHFYTVPPATLG
jgi:hypothetical protein